VPVDWIILIFFCSWNWFMCFNAPAACCILIYTPMNKLIPLID
jgi:hypothetical protein